MGKTESASQSSSCWCTKLVVGFLEFYYKLTPSQVSSKYLVQFLIEINFNNNILLFCHFDALSACKCPDSLLIWMCFSRGKEIAVCLS